MKKLAFAIVVSTAWLVNAAAPEFTAVADWLKLPEGRPQLGNMHGDVAVSSKGEVYVSVQDPDGVAVNQHGDLLVAEFNAFGRVHLFSRQ